MIEKQICALTTAIYHCVSSVTSVNSLQDNATSISGGTFDNCNTTFGEKGGKAGKGGKGGFGYATSLLTKMPKCHKMP